MCIFRRCKLSLRGLRFNLALTFKVETSIEASSKFMGAGLYLDCTCRGALRLPSIPNSNSPQSKKTAGLSLGIAGGLFSKQQGSKDPKHSAPFYPADCLLSGCCSLRINRWANLGVSGSLGGAAFCFLCSNLRLWPHQQYCHHISVPFCQEGLLK